MRKLIAFISTTLLTVLWVNAYPKVFYVEPKNGKEILSLPIKELQHPAEQEQNEVIANISGDKTNTLTIGDKQPTQNDKTVRTEADS